MDQSQLPMLLQFLRGTGNMGTLPPAGGAGATMPAGLAAMQPSWFKNTPYNPATQYAPSAGKMGIAPDMGRGPQGPGSMFPSQTPQQIINSDFSQIGNLGQ